MKNTKTDVHLEMVSEHDKANHFYLGSLCKKMTFEKQ